MLCVLTNVLTNVSICVLERFENMLDLDHVTVSGDVTFSKNVTLKVITETSD